MCLTVFISVLVTLYLLLCVVLYSYYYLIEDVLDLPVIGQSPCSAYAALKQLIEKLLRQALNVPVLEEAHADPATSDTTNKSYEDILATAIINKVITSCQNNLPSTSANSVSSRLSSSSKIKDDKEYFFGEETLDTKWKTTDLDTTSVSSLEEWLQSESSCGSKKYVDRVTLMIKQDIEEVEHFDSENEEDDAEYFRSSSSLLNDSESNWFLQRRKFQGTHSPVPVPMLVPDPSTDAKVLIGDKPLDDTSDLSDVGSDYEETVQPRATHSLLVESKKIIGGGKTKFQIGENADEQSGSSTDSGVKEVNGTEQKSFDIPESSKTDISLDDDNVEDSSFLSAYSNTEKEAEYTEKYESLPRQIVKPSSPHESYTEEQVVSPRLKQGENETHERSNDFQFVGGNYSKREKEKWRHAVEMINNPYSKENIERRVKRSSSAAGSIFGPDYYAKLAGKPSGGEKLSSTEINGVSWPPPETPRSRTPSPPPKLPKVAPPLKEFFEIDSAPSLELLKTSSSLSSLVQNKPDSPPEPPKTGPPPRELTETDGIHKALKAIVTPVQENMPNHYLEAHKDMATQELKSESYQIQSHTVQTNTSEVTSDSDLSFINFYDVQHSQVVRKSKNEDIHIPIKHTPMGVSYRSLPDGNETNVDTLNFHVQHENHLSAFKTPAVKPPVLNIQGKKEKGWFVKGPAAIKQRNISPTEKPILRRNSSESNLMDDSHDTTPKVLHHKKDNTLISKIYKDPKVRLFALHSREEIPGTDQEYIRPAFHSQLSLDSKVALNENSSWYKSHYSFDDGTTSEFESGNTGKMFFFSSEEEDLLSLNLDQSFQAADVTIKNKDIKSNEALYSAQHTSSPNPLMTPRTLSTRKFIYGSQEDLLSIDEIGSIPRRKDNTLISKIYKDPNVRNFALKAHRDFVPDYESTPVSLKPRELFTSDDEQSHTDSNMIIHKRTSINKPTYGSYDDLSSAEISIETHQNHQSIVNPILYSTQQGSVEDGYNSEDLNVNEIARRHVVRQTLGKFSKSEINIKSGFHRSPSLEEGDNIRVSVRDLRKKFENSTGSSKPVISSLTARSLSKQVKESLRQ